MRRIITYAVDDDSGLVYSRVGDELAVPVLEYEKLGEGGDFTQPFTYRLERVSMFALGQAYLHWTRKIPQDIKNLHRQFWGFAPLR